MVGGVGVDVGSKGRGREREENAGMEAVEPFGVIGGATVVEVGKEMDLKRNDGLINKKSHKKNRR